MWSLHCHEADLWKIHLRTLSHLCKWLSLWPFNLLSILLRTIFFLNLICVLSYWGYLLMLRSIDLDLDKCIGLVHVSSCSLSRLHISHRICTEGYLYCSTRQTTPRWTCFGWHLTWYLMCSRASLIKSLLYFPSYHKVSHLMQRYRSLASSFHLRIIFLRYLRSCRREFL